jgi:hypothetical protein
MTDATKPVELTDAERIAHREEIARIRALTGGALAREVLDLIEDNRERWYQGAWRKDHDDKGMSLEPCDQGAKNSYEVFVEDPLNPECKTSFCFAGFVGAIKGVKWAKGDQENVAIPGMCDCPGLCCVNGEHQTSISNYARRELEIGSYDAEKLFNGDNDIEDLRNMVADIVNYGEILSDSDEDGEDDDDF